MKTSIALNIKEQPVRKSLTKYSQSKNKPISEMDLEIDAFLAKKKTMYYTHSYVLAQQDVIVEEIETHRAVYAKLSAKKTVEKLVKRLPNNINKSVLAELIQFILAEWEKNLSESLVSAD